MIARSPLLWVNFGRSAFILAGKVNLPGWHLLHQLGAVAGDEGLLDVRRPSSDLAFAWLIAADGHGKQGESLRLMGNTRSVGLALLHLHVGAVAGEEPLEGHDERAGREIHQVVHESDEVGGSDVVDLLLHSLVDGFEHHRIEVTLARASACIVAAVHQEATLGPNLDSPKEFVHGGSLPWLFCFAAQMRQPSQFPSHRKPYLIGHLETKTEQIIIL